MAKKTAAEELAELWGSDSDSESVGGGGRDKGDDEDDVWGSDGDDVGDGGGASADAARRAVAERDEANMRKKHYNV